MTQCSFDFKYEEGTKNIKLTALAGLPLYLDLLNRSGITKAMRKYLDIGVSENIYWKPSNITSALIMLNLANGDHIDDLNILKADTGFCTLLDKINMHGLTNSQRRARRRIKKQQKIGAIPSPTTTSRFLKQDGNEGLNLREPGKAYIPEAGNTTRQLSKCNQDIISTLEYNNPSETITLDMDATLIETYKSNAFYSYKGYLAYQPLNIWWDEHRMLLHTQFRDGNVPAGYDLQKTFSEAISLLPKNIGSKNIFMRSDSAGYRIDLLKYCEDKNIQFAVGCPISTAIRKAIKEVPQSEWKPLDKIREYAEVCFVPNSLSTSKTGYEFRYVAIREILLEQKPLIDMPIKEYPFPTITLEECRYKVHAIVTNRSIPATELVPWYYKRCGHSEEVHAVLKNELAGGTLPTNNFHANAIWWMISVISHNIHSMFKQLCCGKDWISAQLKRIRFNIICIAGQIVERGRQLYCRLNHGHPCNALFQLIREAIVKLRPCPV